MVRRVSAGIAVVVFLWAVSFGVHARLAFLAFAAFNLLLIVPGTRAIRWSAAAGAGIAALSTPMMPLVALSIALVWPFAMLIVWGTSSDRARAAAEAGIGGESMTRARLTLAAIVVAVAAAVLVDRQVVAHHLEQSAALFVGAPSLLAIVVILFVSPKSATGVIFKAVTVALLLSALFLWEGMLCIIMAAPVFYAVAGIIGASIDHARRVGNGTVASCLVALSVLPLVFEDTGVGIAFNRRETVSMSRVVSASPDAVAAAIAQPPRFDRALPGYLRAGFPRPIATRISADASTWTVRMRGGEMKINGMEPREGDLTLRIVERTPHTIRWRADSDDSHMTHFQFWREARVEWHAVDGGRTEVTWSLSYDRNLAPAWYFGPWERYATRLAAGYLIDAVATP